MKIFRTRSVVEAEAIEGLGNQLFCYAAGLFLAKNSNSKLILNVSRIGTNPINHGKTILNFNLDCRVKNSLWIGSRGYRIQNRIISKLIKQSSLFRKVHKVLIQIIELYSPSYVANDIGYEPEFAALREPRRIHGYFQSYNYTNSVRGELNRTLTLKNETSWFKSQLIRMDKEDPIVIHMRRGDYISNPEIGVLALEYYLNAFRYLCRNSEDRKVWIFTDSPEFVRNEIISTELQDAEIVIPPIESNPNESMVLMSHAADIVISNSTFSWWSAYLSVGAINVVGPSKWFRSLKDPVGLRPSEWHLMDSIWVDF